MEKTVTISKAEYDKLVEDSLFLQALYAAGVDNWEGFGFAVTEFSEINDESLGIDEDEILEMSRRTRA